MSPEFIAWLKTPARRVLLAEVDVKSGGSETTRYLSTLGFAGHDGRIDGGFTFGQSLDLSGSGGGLSWGELTVDNTDGALDGWLDDIWAGRGVRLYMGGADWLRGDFVQVFAGTVEDLDARERGRLVLKVRDSLATLNAPLATALLGGTGDNKDALLPYVVGEAFNVSPLLTSTTGPQVYQVSRGPVQQIVEVRDNGFPVARTDDLAAGTFTLTSQRYGLITCDVLGVKVGGSYRNDVGGLIEWAATSLGDGDKLTAGDFDAAALAAFRAAYPQPVGAYLPERVNRLELMQQLAASVGATVTATPLGKVQIVPLAYGTPAGSITHHDMAADSFRPVRRLPVRGAVQLRGCRNWTPQDKSSLAASLSSPSLPILSDEWVSVVERDNAVIADYKQPDTPAPVDTLLIVDTDLTAQAAARLALWSTPRTLYSFEGFAEMMQVGLGETWTISHPRFGLSGGAPGLVVGLETDFVAGRVRVEVII